MLGVQCLAGKAIVGIVIADRDLLILFSYGCKAEVGPAARLQQIACQVVEITTATARWYSRTGRTPSRSAVSAKS